MRILFVIHNFLPAHRAGSETYAFHLAKALKRERPGTDLRIFTTDTHPQAVPYELHRYEWQGLPVIEINQLQDHVRFSGSFSDPEVENRFETELRHFMPEVVHFHHLMHFSAGMVDRIPASVSRVMHLHDFWLTCARGGQRLDEKGQICSRIDLDKCARCIAGSYLDISAGGRIAEHAEALVGEPRRSIAPGGGRLRGFVRRIAPHLPRGIGLPPKYDPAEVRKDLEMRERELRRVCGGVDAFIAPSRFLGNEIARWGVPADQIEYSDYGFAAPEPDRIRVPTVPGGVFTVGFAGTLAPHKGPHIVLQAFRKLQNETRRAVALRIYGNRSHFPAYVRLLDRMAEGLPLEWAGSFDDEGRDDAYASIDALVVPSLWWENSPLIIHEAFQRRVPVVVSDLGGMSELVLEGKGGLRFPAGDATALAAQLRWLAEDEEFRQQVALASPPVKSIEEDARWTWSLYERLAVHRRVH